ncbi:hypothetical protein DYQ94_00850 [Xanthomonas sp. LMG 8993]|nr:hypothetical protein [Xanthomonas sp. LMG 8993]
MAPPLPRVDACARWLDDGLCNAAPGAHNNRITTADCRRCRLLALLHMPYDRYVLRDVGNVPMP